MLECLDLYRQQKECVPYKRAQRLIAAADPGCDNPAEAALLWVLKSVSAFEVVTQFEIVVNGRRYFADIAIPGLMIIFEFDGIGKLGSSPVEWCNRFVSFGLGYALSWSGVSSCWVGWGVSRDLVRMSRLR